MRNDNTTTWTTLAWNSGAGAWSGQHRPPMVFEVRYSEAARRERRSAARVATALTAFYGGAEKKFHPASLADVSPTGVRLLLNEQVAVGCQLQFTVRFDDVLVQLSGQVVWQRRAGKAEWSREAGLRLVSLDRSTRAALNRWCRRSGTCWESVVVRAG